MKQLDLRSMMWMFFNSGPRYRGLSALQHQYRPTPRAMKPKDRVRRKKQGKHWS